MSRRLVVWLTSAGTEDIAVAAASKRGAVAALNAAHRNWSLYAFNQFASDLDDTHPIAVMALGQPGVVFARSNRWPNEPWSIVSPATEGANMSTRTKEALATIYGDTPTDDASNPGAAARRAELRDLSGRGRKSRTTNQQKEEAMTTQLREKAEAMNLTDLRKALTPLGVTGASKLNKADAVAAFVKASKPKSSRNGNGSGPSENQTRVPSPIAWESTDGQFTGQSPSANWNGSRYVIKNYLDSINADADEVKAALKEAKAKLDGGAKSVKVLNVTIKVYDPNA